MVWERRREVEHELGLKEPERIAHRQFCSMCHGACVVDFAVPTEVWQAAVHRRWWNDKLCLWCFARHADEKLIEWCKDIQLKPRSLAQQHRHLLKGPTAPDGPSTNAVWQTSGDVPPK